jgi:hypothetical protein
MMSHYAKVVNGTVTQVIVAEADFFKTFVDTSPGTWLQTSYNTRGNVHYLPNSNTPSGNSALRGNYAGIGYIYDQAHDMFYPPQPVSKFGNVSYTLNTSTWTWIANANVSITGNTIVG